MIITTRTKTCCTLRCKTQPICYDDSVKNIVDKFKDNQVDFHQTVADMANISRTQAKTINLGLFYGMGKAKLQAELGLNTKAEAEDLFNQYHQNVPFVRDLNELHIKPSSTVWIYRNFVRT